MSNRTIRVGYVLKMFPRLSETFVLNEVLELERQGLQIEIFSLKAPAQPRFHSKLARLEAQIHYLIQERSTSSMWQSLRSDFEEFGLDPLQTGRAFLLTLQSGQIDSLFQAMKLVVSIRRLGITHLHSHFATSATWVTFLAHLLSGVSFSFTAHAKDLYHRDADSLLLTEAMQRASFVVTVTDHNVAHLRGLAPTVEAARKIDRIYNGIPLEEFHAAPVLVGSSPVILGVGRLVEKKGFRYLVDACSLLKEREIGFRCVLIGDGVEEPRLRSRISELGLEESVELRGAQSQDVVIDQIAQATLLALPCIVARDGNRDALPTVLLEAMALGRPVVSTDLPGVTEIVDHGLTGLLVPQNDGTSLADAIERIIREPELGLKLGQNGRRKVEKLFNLQSNVDRLASLFRKATALQMDAGVAAGSERA